MDVTPLHRSLEQELNALVRGASLECLVCGEFVLRREGAIACPECESILRAENTGEAGLQLELQAG